MLLMACCVNIRTQAQYNPHIVVDKIANFPPAFFYKIDKKTRYVEEQLICETEKYLQRLSLHEKKLQQQLSKIHLDAAKQLFANSEEQYRQLIDKIKNKGVADNSNFRGEYLACMDSMKTSLAFLQQNSQLVSGTIDTEQKIKSSLGNVKELEGKLQQTEEVKAFIQQRKQLIKDQLSKYTGLPNSVTSCFTDFKEQAYYYSAQVKEYRNMLNDPDRMVEKGLSLLNKLPAFTQFMKQSSELAALFQVPSNYGSPASLAGLQTRAQLQQQIQTQLASAGPDGQQYLQQSLQAAQSQTNNLKEKLLKSTTNGNGGDVDMPGFKPNDQKTKTFWNRLEYGANFQTARSNFFPITTDIALSVGYKLNSKNTIGVGASYKLGWGESIKHISITQQGMGIRSFLDVKLKGSFYASGGFEYNYQPLSPEIVSSIGSMGKSQSPAAWSKSGLIGISKIVSVKSKFFKKTKLQLLCDFLSYQQVPRTQALKFRVGYVWRQ
jgi:hypothetical protein